MGTNKIVLKSAEQFMADYTPVYQPLFSLLLQAKTQLYSQLVGQVDFKRVKTVGDIRLKHITPKDTEMKQVAVGEEKKSYKKYFLGKQYSQSNLQDAEGNQDVVAQVLDENNKLADELFLYGEGTQNSDVVNNGLFFSLDSNFTAESSATIGTSPSHIDNMYTTIMGNATKADNIAGRKLLIVYGATACAKLDTLFSSTGKSLKQVLQENLPGYQIVKMPSAVTLNGVNGWLIVNLDQIKIHYAALPELNNQGVDERAMETWHNFLMGSAMVEVLVKDAIIKQPATFS